MKRIDYFPKRLSEVLWSSFNTFIEVIIFRLKTLHCHVNQDNEMPFLARFDLVTLDLEHEVRLVLHGLA